MPDATLERRRAVLHALQRQHIIEGFVSAATDKGYADATIADIVRHAHVSKRTFYEHFTDKEAVYLALHAEVADGITDALSSSLERTTGQPNDARIADLVHTYIEAMASHPTWLAQVRIEPQIASRAARQARIAGGRRLRPIHRALLANRDDPYGDTLITIALTGTVELIASTAERRPNQIRDLEPAIRELWLRLSAPPNPQSTRHTRRDHPTTGAKRTPSKTPHT